MQPVSGALFGHDYGDNAAVKFSFLLKTFWQNVKIIWKENSYEGGKCCFYI